MNFVPTRSEGEIFAEYVDAMNQLYDPARYLGRAFRNTVAHVATSPAVSSKPAPRDERGVVDKLRALAPELPLLGRLVWRNGIRPSSRRHFWRYLARVLAERPDRVGHYFDQCAVATDLVRTRDMARVRAAKVWGASGPPPRAAARGAAPPAPRRRRLPVVAEAPSKAVDAARER